MLQKSLPPHDPPWNRRRSLGLDLSLEFYNAARRLGKEVIFLSYPGEPHHLRKEENQKDFQLWMKQYFDHYLKGAAPPDWMVNGIPYPKNSYKENR